MITIYFFRYPYGLLLQTNDCVTKFDEVININQV